MKMQICLQGGKRSPFDRISTGKKRKRRDEVPERGDRKGTCWENGHMVKKNLPENGNGVPCHKN